MKNLDERTIEKVWEKDKLKAGYGELNVFLKYALWVGIIIGIIQHYGNNKEYISIHEKYLYLFMAVNFITGAVSIIGCLIILRMKNFIGYLVMVFNVLFLFFLGFILNYLLKYNIFDMNDTIIFNISSISIISLLMLLKNNTTDRQS
jgi:hypothetical protein